MFLYEAKDNTGCNKIKFTVRNIDYKYFLNLSTLILGNKINYFITVYDNKEVVLKINFKL